MDLDLVFEPAHQGFLTVDKRWRKLDIELRSP